MQQIAHPEVSLRHPTWAFASNSDFGTTQTTYPQVPVAHQALAQRNERPAVQQQSIRRGALGDSTTHELPKV